MGLSNQLSCEAGSLSCHCNSHRFLQSEVLRLYFLMLEPWVSQSVLLPICSYWFVHMQMWDCLIPQPQPLPPRPPAAALPQVLSIWLPISAPPTSLDECFFFNSLVVRFPYSLIFWQFCLIFVFKFVVALLLVVRGGTVYLPMPLSWPEVL